MSSRRSPTCSRDTRSQVWVTAVRSIGCSVPLPVSTPAELSSTMSSIATSTAANGRAAIPSGRVSVAAASGLGVGLLLAGVTAGFGASHGAGLVALTTAGCILLYDSWGKRQGLLGPVNMGMCRGLNLLLGVAAAPAVLSTAWPLALLPLVYIAAVTAVSRGEVHGGRRGIAVFALISLTVVLLGLAAVAVGMRSLAGAILTVALAWRVLPAFWALTRIRPPDRSHTQSEPACCRWCCLTP